jgi:hypothetical protein
MTMPKKIFNLSVIVVLALSLTAIGFAQSRQTGSISGLVLDEQGVPLPGAIVTISGPALMGALSYVTSETGRFRFPALPPGEYEAKVELPGFRSYVRTGLICNVGKTIDCKVRLIVATLEEEITVTAEAPVIDIESSKVSVHFDEDFLLSIPQARDLYGIQQALPGAIKAEAGREYTRMSSILGGTVRSTLYLLDGAIMNDPTTMYVGANLNVDIYEEIEIGIGALPAEVGLTDSTVINIVTKSGGNRFSGMLSGYYTGESLATDLWSEEQVEALNVVPARKYSSYYDGSASFGGPIMKDKIWFFLNVRHIDFSQDVPFTAHTRIQEIYDPTYPYFHENDLVPYNIQHQDWLGFGKLTLQITPSIRYMGMFYYSTVYEPIHSLNMGNDDAWSNCKVFDGKILTTSHHFSWVLNQNTFLDIHGNYLNRHHPNLGQADVSENYFVLNDAVDIEFGNVPHADDYFRKRLGVSASITSFLDNFLGASHEFKAGVEWEDTIYARDRHAGRDPGGNPYYTYWNDFTERDKYWYGSYQGRLRLKPLKHWKGGMVGEDNTRRFSGFVQDSIVTGRLAINLGLRLDYSYGYEPEQNRPEIMVYNMGPEFLNPNLNSPDPNILLMALNDQYHNDPDVDYNQLSPLDPYTFPYLKTVAFTTLSPRIGFVYDVFGDGKTAIKASFARYFEPVWSGKYNDPQKFGPAMNWRWYDRNQNGYMDLPLPADQTSYGKAPVDPQYLDPTGDEYRLTEYSNQDPDLEYYRDLKAPYMHEFLVGVEQEVMKDFRIGARFIYKVNKNITETIDPVNGYDPTAKDAQGRPIWLPYTTTDPGWDGEFGTGDDQQITVYGLADYSPTQYFIGTTPPETKREYMAGMLTFDKRMSNRWMFTGSILYSAFKGNAQPTYGQTEGHNDFLENPNTLINAYGRIDFDHPLQVKLMGTVMLPYDFAFTAYFQFRSGSPWARTLDRVYFPDDMPVQESYTGNIWTAPQGEKRNPPRTTLDLRLEKSFSFGDYGKLSLYVDGFNIAGSKYLNVSNNPDGRVRGDRDPIAYTLHSNYGRINDITGVRSFRFGLRWSF